MKDLWMGEPVENLTKEELIEALRCLAKILEEAREDHRHTLEVLG